MYHPVPACSRRGGTADRPAIASNAPPKYTMYQHVPLMAAALRTTGGSTTFIAERDGRRSPGTWPVQSRAFGAITGRSTVPPPVVQGWYSLVQGGTFRRKSNDSGELEGWYNSGSLLRLLRYWPRWGPTSLTPRPGSLPRSHPLLAARRS